MTTVDSALGIGYDPAKAMKAVVDGDDNQPVCGLCGEPYSGTCPDCTVNIYTYPIDVVSAQPGAHNPGTISNSAS